MNGFKDLCLESVIQAMLGSTAINLVAARPIPPSPFALRVCFAIPPGKGAKVLIPAPRGRGGVGGTTTFKRGVT